MTNDKFGVLQFYSTKTAGLEWFNNWNNGKERSLSENNFDPYDPKLQYKNGSPDSTKLKIDGKGSAKVTDYNSSARMFVVGPWMNTEMTLYTKKENKLQDVQLRSRSNHENKCGFGNYEAVWNHEDKKSAVEVELLHPIYKRDLNKKPLPLGIPKNIWIGTKQITRTVGGNKVLVEGYINYSELDQTKWVKTTEFTFDGTNVNVTGYDTNKDRLACVGKGDKTADNLNASTLWLKEGKWCWARINNCDDVKFKWYSVREIDPL